MPIRMEKDDPQHSNQGNNSGGGGNILKWLPFILMFVLKRPKLILPLLVIGGIWYFFFGGSQMFSNVGEFDPADANFSFGAALDQEKFDQAKVFEPLAYGDGMNRLPTQVSLDQHTPTPRHQGSQGSCVGWASAYAARTILQSTATNQQPNNLAFSPAYLYNQIALPGCQGAYMLDAMKAMQQNGAVPFTQFRYDESTCATRPQNNHIQTGKQFRIKGYNRLTLGASNYKPDITAIKQHLAQNAPVVIGMQVGGTFMSRMLGQDLWRPDQRDYSLRGFSGHAMCVTGYDDNKYGGAFHIMNSWGTDWGNRGKAWVTYKDFQYFVKEAYGLHPMASPEQQRVNDNRLNVEFGLIDMASKSLINLKQTGDMVFQTVNPIAVSSKFKVLIGNDVECHIYVFGQETDGSSYVLFPYTEKHSPYCGITGTRLFPKDYSMTPDEVGNQDVIAVIVTKQPIDFNTFNQRVNSSRQSQYAGKIRDALGGQRVSAINFKQGETVAFETNLNGKNAVAAIINIDKQ